MEELQLQPVHASGSNRLVNRTHSQRLDTISRDGSFNKVSWRKRIRSYAYTDNITYLQRTRSESEVETAFEDVQEVESGSDTEEVSEDGTEYLRDLSWQRGGRLMFQSQTSSGYAQDYLLLNSSSSIEDAVVFMAKRWMLPLPKVVLSVISNVDYFITPNESSMEELELGILQSACLTNMWILTDGLNYGPGRIIGEAVAYEKHRRRLFASENYKDEVNLTAIAVVSSDQLRYGVEIEECTTYDDEKKTHILENVGDDKRELNPQYSHSLILSSSDPIDKEATQILRFNLEARLSQMQHVRNVASKGRKSAVTPSSKIVPDASVNMATPVVALMIQGGPAEIERVLWLLKKNIPIIVVTRKGYASGLVASAYKEFLRADASRIEHVYKPQLMSRVKEDFADYCGDNDLLRQQVRDRILEVAKIALHSERELLFIVEPDSPDEDLRDVNKSILEAIWATQSDSTEQLTRENVTWMMRLALHWNRVDFVTKKILNPYSISRFKVRDDLFVEALLLEDREPFVELFLDQGFLLQRLMTYEQVLRLFEASLSEEFFVTICLQNILHKKSPELGTKFMHEKNCELNTILCALSGLSELVDPTFLLITEIQKNNSNVLEKRALMTILYWAVLTNKIGLVKVLWKRSAEPIAVALVISNMYYRMSKYYIKDIDLKVSVKEQAREFGALAIKIMDLTFNDSRLLAFHSLTNPIQEFNNLNVVDLALIGNNIFFIAHPCCQRSVRERWFGNIQIKSSGTAYFNVPEFLKIYLCVVLVFPMYFWLTFKPMKRIYPQAMDDEEDKEDKNKNNMINLPKDQLPNINEWPNNRSIYKDTSPNIVMKVYYLWSAPITKFWVNQFWVLAYLFLYATAVMQPYCGDATTNWLLCIWTIVLIFENVSQTGQKLQKFPTMKIMWPLVNLTAEVATVFVLLWHMLAGNVNFMTYKLLMALSMLAVYFCALRDILTASPELGPMLVNITELTRKDLINWLRLWLMCLISGGLAINAVIYPAQSFTLVNFGRSMLRAILGIWLTEIDDLEGDSTCSFLYDTEEISRTCEVSSISPFVRKRLENCPFPSIPGYLVVIQYLTITRLVFYTLMFAMFSATISRTQERSVELWKYQFQSIVTDFESRPIIPAPLNVITYPFRLSYFLGYVAMEIMLEFSACCREVHYQTKRDQATSIPYNQWKSYLKQIEREKEEKENEVNDIISILEEATATQRSSIKQLTDNLVYIERHQTMTAVYLEDLKKKLESLDPKVRAQTQRGGVPDTHTMARQTPYPGTEIERFPLLDKDVPWDMVFEAYDPATFTKPVEEFPEDEQPIVDIDVLSLPMIDGQYQTAAQVTDADGNIIDTAPGIRTQEVEIVYNAIQTLMLVSGQEIMIDRRSYIADNDQILQYEVDASGVPINPMGRTGLRGRGNLPRWGPNHFIKAVISRLNITPNPASSRASNTEIKSSLQILVRTNPDTGTMALIGGAVQPGRTPYSTLCDKLTDVFPDSNTNHGENADYEEMIHTFSKFASHIYGKKSKAGYATYGYSAFLVYRGYEDSPMNTDNAWQECEIYNFHYKHNDCFGSRVKEDDTVGWQTVTDQMPLSHTELDAVREADKIRTRTVS